MKLRDAAEADLPAIVEIYNAAVATRLSTAQLAPVTVAERLPWFREHSPNGHPIWVMEEAGEIAGWFSFSEFVKRAGYRGTAEISVYVHEKFQGRGIGRALLAEAIARSPALRFTVLLGLIFGHNTPSLELFLRLGFERWGTLPRVACLEGIERDVVIFGRHIPPA